VVDAIVAVLAAAEETVSEDTVFDSVLESGVADEEAAGLHFPAAIAADKLFLGVELDLETTALGLVVADDAVDVSALISAGEAAAATAIAYCTKNRSFIVTRHQFTACD
jgi:hypothetical protein